MVRKIDKTSHVEAKTLLPSEKCVIRTKTSHANAKTSNLAKSSTANAKRVFPAEISLSKHTFAFARDVFAWQRRFRSVMAFLPLQTLFSLGKSVFAFAIDVFARYSVIAFASDVFVR